MSTVVIVIILAIALIGVGAAFVLLSGQEDGKPDEGATPKEAFQDWVAAFNANDWEGIIGNSTLHFAPASAQNAILGESGEFAWTVICENITEVPNAELPAPQKSFIESELSSLQNQSVLLEYEQYKVITYDLNLSYDGLKYEWWQMHTVMLQSDGRWYRTYIDLDYLLWNSDLWQYDWYRPNSLSYPVILNDTGVWSVVFLSCPVDIPVENLTISFTWDQVYGEGPDTRRYSVGAWLVEGLSQNPIAWSDKMSPDDIANASHYHIGFVDVQGDGLLSIGDRFYIVMDQPSGDDARLPSGTVVTVYVAKHNSPPWDDTYVTSGRFLT